MGRVDRADHAQHIALPTDPAAQARIAKLTDQLTEQVRPLEKAKEEARRRAAGG